jgi:hypothetical protein
VKNCFPEKSVTIQSTKLNKITLSKTQLPSFLLVLATIFGLGMTSSGQNIYQNLLVHASVYNVLFIDTIGPHLQSYSPIQSLPAVVVLSVLSITNITYIVIILKLIILILKLICKGKQY